MKFNWNYTFVANSPLAILWAFVMIDGLVLTMTPVNLLLAIGITGIVWLIYYLLFERNYFRSHPLFNPQNQKAGKAASLVTILGAWLSLILFFLTRNALLIFSLPIFTLWLTLILYVCFVSTTIDWPIFLITIAIFSICMTTYYFLFQRKYYQTHSEMNPQNRKFKHSIIIPTMGLMISLTAYLLSHIPLITIGVLSLAVFIQAGYSVAK